MRDYSKFGPYLQDLILKEFGDTLGRACACVCERGKADGPMLRS